MMKYRALGRTGFMASQMGAGDLADRSLPLETCVATLERAFQVGINVVDTAPGYEDGFSEQIVGQAVRFRRDDVFVITKIDDFDRPLTQQLTESLDRMQTRYVDGYVFHGLSDMATYERLCAEGYFAQLADLKARGLVRFGGISSHHPEVLRAAILAGYCDIAMFAVGAFVDDRYVHDTLPLCRDMGVASVCFKTFGGGKLVADTEGYGRPLAQRPRGKLSSGGAELPVSATQLSVAECLHYTLTVNPDVALLGLSFANEQDAAFVAYREFCPLDDHEMRVIRAKAAIARADKGPCWWNPDPTQ